MSSYLAHDIPPEHSNYFLQCERQPPPTFIYHMHHSVKEIRFSNLSNPENLNSLFYLNFFFLLQKPLPACSPVHSTLSSGRTPTIIIGTNVIKLIPTSTLPPSPSPFPSTPSQLPPHSSTRSLRSCRRI